jgi:hypothetical protein
VLALKFLMNNTRGCSHPSHIARADFSAANRAVTMFDFAAVHDGYCFKTAMRMWPTPKIFASPGIRLGQHSQVVETG